MASEQQVAFFPISELSGYQSRWTIKAKVNGKSQLRTFGEAGGKVFSAELVDNQGGEIKASFFNDAAAKFLDVLQVGKVFTFSRGTVKVANKQYNNCNHRYELTFDRDAQVAEVTGETGEYKAHFNFTDLRAARSKEVPCRVDLCGIVTQFRPPANITAKDGRELLKREITVVDDTGTSMELTLWGEHAKLPDSDFEGKPVVGFKNILMKEFSGDRTGGTVESSSLTFKPDVPAAKRIEQWWAQGGSKQSFADFVSLKDVQSKPAPCRVDLCGVVTEAKPIATVTTKDGRELLKRDITIADDTGVSMEVTLWGDKGKRPDSDFEGNPVIMLTAVSVKEFNGGRNGSTLSASAVVLKPDVPEAKKIEQWWAEGGSSQRLVSLRGAGGGGGAAANAEHCSVSEMRRKSETIGDQVKHYKVATRLALVQMSKQGEQIPLHYKACAELKDGSFGKLPCNRRVDESGFCASCNMAGKTAIRLNLRCRFADFGDSVWLTTFHEAAEQVLGMSANKVAELGAEREKLEAVLLQTYFAEPLELTVRAKIDTWNGEARANVTCVGAAPVNRRERGRRLLSEIQEMLAASD